MAEQAPPQEWVGPSKDQHAMGLGQSLALFSITTLRPLLDAFQAMEHLVGKGH